MGRALTILFALVITITVLFTYASSTTGVCYSQGSRSVPRQYSHAAVFYYTYKCGWWYAYRCRATRYRTEYATRYVTEYYSRRGCCHTYTDYAGACRRVEIGFERSSYSVSEDAGQINVCATIQQAVEMESWRDFTVEFRTVSGSALENSDFTPVRAYRRYLSNERRSVCVSIPITYDYRYEGSETFYVHLTGQSLPSYAHLVSTSTTVQISNTIRMQIGFERTSQSVNEDDGSASVCLGIRQPSGNNDTIQNTDYRVNFETRAGSGALTPHDFGTVRQEVTLTTRSRHQCVNVPIVHDTLHEETEIFEAILIPRSLPSNVTISPNTTTISIINTHRTVIGFERTAHSVAEDAGNITECVILSHIDTSTASRRFEVDVTAITNSAMSPEDFIFTPTTLNLSSISPRQCFNITIVHDSLYESSESFNVSLSKRTTTLSSSALLSPAIMTIRIDNRHRVTIGLEHTSLEVDENAGNVTVCVQLILHDAGQDIRSLGSNSFRVDIRTAHTNGENGAIAPDDFHSRSSTVTLSSSTPRSCLVIPIIHDTLLERTESFLVRVSRNQLPSYVSLQPDTAVVRIRHVHGMLIGFEQDHIQALENSSRIQICVVVTFPTSPTAPLQDGQYRVVVSATSGTGESGAQVAQDFLPLSTVVTLTPTTRRQCVHVNIVSDTVVEISEWFTVRLSRSSTLPSYVGFSPANATVTIYDLPSK